VVRGLSKGTYSQPSVFQPSISGVPAMSHNNKHERIITSPDRPLKLAEIF